MDQFDPTIDAAFLEYADLELRCHRLLSAGKDDSVEMADAEDRMEKLWAKLDEVQKRSLRGMASDLGWVRVKGTSPPKGRKTPDEISQTERQELATARGRIFVRALPFGRAPKDAPRRLRARRRSAHGCAG